MANANPCLDPSPSAPPKTPRREYWRALIEECDRSGLSQMEFCQQRDVARRSLSFWKWKLSREAGPRGRPGVAGRARGAPRPSFVPVRVVSSRHAGSQARPSPPPAAAGELEIALASGPLVRVRGRVEARWLKEVISMLEASRC